MYLVMFHYAEKQWQKHELSDREMCLYIMFPYVFVKVGNMRFP